MSVKDQARHLIAFCSSVLLHITLAALVIIRMFGTEGFQGQDSGSGMYLAVVDAGSLTFANRPTRSEPRDGAEGDNGFVIETSTDLASVTAPVVSANVEKLTERRPDDADEPSSPAIGQAEQLSSGPAGPAQAVLLERIARCLPPGYLPALSLSELVLKIGPKGDLSAAPEVNSFLPRMSAEDRLAADRVVQAALLCGPYDGDGVANQVISLVPDFSSIQPRVVAGGLLDVASGVARPRQ